MKTRFCGKSTELIEIFNRILQIVVMLKYFKYEHIIRCKIIIINLLIHNKIFNKQSLLKKINRKVLLCDSM